MVVSQEARRRAMKRHSAAFSRIAVLGHEHLVPDANLSITNSATSTFVAFHTFLIAICGRRQVVFTDRP